MTLPNKLTMGRILLIPVMIILFYIEPLRQTAFNGVSWLYIIEFIIFVLASLTDFLDGYIARKYNLITTFGKFADPLADKLLVVTAMTIIMVDGNIINVSGVNISLVPMWVFLIILIREFMVSGIRMVASANGVVLAAGKMGKWKTFITMIALCVCFFNGADTANVMFWIGHGLMLVACVLTILSGIEYFWKNRKVILESI